MAVTLKLEDPKKQKKKSATSAAAATVKAAAALDDFALPQEKKEGLKALGFWTAIMLVVGLPWLFFDATVPIGKGILAWWVMAGAGYLFVWPWMIQRRLRMQPPEGIISTTNQPRVAALLQRGSGVLGIPPPEGFIETDGTPRVLVLPNAVVVRKTASTILEPDEINCLAVLAMVHLRQHQARRFAMLRLIDETPKPARVLIWPVLIYATLLRAMWLPLAHKTADRLSLFLIKNPRLLMAAVLKEHAAHDPNMREMEITSQDVTNWIQQAGHIGMAGEEISTQYKLGRTIHDDPALEERLQAVQAWGESAEFKTALAEMNSSRAPGK